MPPPNPCTTFTSWALGEHRGPRIDSLPPPRLSRSSPRTLTSSHLLVRTRRGSALAAPPAPHPPPRRACPGAPESACRRAPPLRPCGQPPPRFRRRAGGAQRHAVADGRARERSHRWRGLAAHVRDHLLDAGAALADRGAIGAALAQRTHEALDLAPRLDRNSSASRSARRLASFLVTENVRSFSRFDATRRSSSARSAATRRVRPRVPRTRFPGARARTPAGTTRCPPPARRARPPPGRSRRAARCRSRDCAPRSSSQPIERPRGLVLEGRRGVRHAVAFPAQGFDAAVVGARDHGGLFEREHPLEGGGAIAAPSSRVGAVADFVDQTERVGVGGAAHLIQVAQVQRETDQSDDSSDCSSPMSANTCSNTGSSLPCARNRQHAEGRSDPTCFDRHGLAAGVGTGDDQQPPPGLE